MKVFRSTLVFLAFTMMSSVGFSESTFGEAHFSKEGHGGRSIVCRDEWDKIISAELLDFYEAPVMYPIKIRELTSPIEEQLLEIGLKLDRAVRWPFMSSSVYPDLFAKIHKTIRFIRKGTRLKLIDDSYEVIDPTGSCKPEQLAVYVDQNTLLIDPEIWSKLKPWHQAGLIAHEGIYLMDRAYGSAVDSRYARKMNSYAFSSFEFENRYEGVPREKETLWCKNDRYEFFVFKGLEEKTSRFQFIKIAGKAVFSKKTFDVGLEFPFVVPRNGEIKLVEIAGDAKSKIDINDDIARLTGRYLPDGGWGEFEWEIAVSTPEDPAALDLFRFSCEADTLFP